MKSFTLRVGGAEYRVQRSPEPLFNADGLRVASLVDHGNPGDGEDRLRIIWLDLDLPDADVPQVCCLAYAEALRAWPRIPLVA